jgi:uncharacterized protein (DUF433 family)
VGTSLRSFAHPTTVGDVLGWLAAGLSHEQILADYPELTENDIRACLAYAADRERRLVMTSFFY